MEYQEEVKYVSNILDRLKEITATDKALMLLKNLKLQLNSANVHLLDKYLSDNGRSFVSELENISSVNSELSYSLEKIKISYDEFHTPGTYPFSQDVPL